MEDQPEFVENDGRGLAKLTPQSGSIFSSLQTMEDATKIATELSNSSLVPQAYQKNVPNTLIAMEMSNRIGTSVFMVMQNLDIIYGKPSWRASFIIAALQACGRFGTHRFEWNRKDNEGKRIGRNDESFGCRFVAPERQTGDILKGPWVTWGMVRAEGWDQRRDKKGNLISKWNTMPELMFQYRAATLFGRLYAPDILTGMQSADEVIDIPYREDRTSEELSERVKNKRVRDWIEKAETVAELYQVEEEVRGNKEDQLCFDEKEKELKNATKK